MFNPNWARLGLLGMLYLTLVGPVTGSAAKAFADDSAKPPAQPPAEDGPVIIAPAAHPHATTGPATTAPAFKPAMIGNAELYMEIPIMGAIGEDTISTGFSMALDAAKARRVREVVLRIDTTRGTIDEVNAIVDLIHKTQGQPFKFHALVQNAAWLTTPIVFACDTIDVLPGATLGGDPDARKAKKFQDKSATDDANGASADSSKSSTGEPDDKDVLALAGNVTSSTPMPAVLLALTMGEAHVFVWKDESKQIQVSEERPAGVDEDKFLVKDADNNRLKMTGDQAVAIGLATPYKDVTRPPSVPKEQAVWAEVQPKGRFYMQIALSRQKQAKNAADQKSKTDALTAGEMAEKVKKLNDIMTYRADDADQNDPKTGFYSGFRELSGIHLTGKSILEWQTRTDTALKAWSDVKEAAEMLVSMNDEATKGNIKLDIDIAKAQRELALANEKIDWLNKHRNDVTVSTNSTR